MDQDAERVALAIADAVDQIFNGAKDTAILQFTEHGQGTPGLAVVITKNQRVIPELVEWIKEKENEPARPPSPFILRPCPNCGEWPAQCRCASPEEWGVMGT